MIRLKYDDEIDLALLDPPPRPKHCRVDIEDDAIAIIRVGGCRSDTCGDIRQNWQGARLDAASPRSGNDAGAVAEHMLITFELVAALHQAECEGRFPGALRSGEEEATSAAPQGGRMQENGIRPLFNGAAKQVDVKIFENRTGTEDTVKDGPVLDDPVVIPKWFDDYHHVLWGRPADLRLAGEKLDRVEDVDVRGLQPESAIERANNYFALDVISPSFTRESRQALISA